MCGTLVRSAVGAACILLGLYAPCFAQTEPLRAAGGGGLLVLLQTGASAELRFSDGATLTITLPQGVELTALASLETGWIAAGSQKAPDSGRGLFLVRGDRSRAEPLATPPDQEHRLRRAPVLLTHDGRLAGLAWLEGDGGRSLAVRAAPWKAGRFAAPSWVSRQGPGSQLALSGVVLADGSWLLAWSAFDGTDDEVVWSRYQSGVWSPVRPVSADNAVPDITPHLVAAGDGALLAWSRYERESGGYRVRLSRFVGGAFADERSVGEPGSLHPRLSLDGDRLVLSYVTVLPRARSVAELDPTGRVLRRALLPRETPQP